MTANKITTTAEGTTARSHPATAAEARASVRRLLHKKFCTENAGTVEDFVLANALLVTSELVTNAIVHGGGLARFTARITDGGLRLSVTDRSRVRPTAVHRPNEAAGMQPGGYGWNLVQRLSSDITVSPIAGGKTIQVLVPLI
ncbi:ATP-binding protein [Streptomyces sp. NPDC057445]|uniref:ATP-binding protein n=1 Tax=Streptomyces sp. NPDC057445 TaxID=3346136 RepID=UPI00369EDFD7